MAKYYTQIVGHCVRFYLAHPTITKFKTKSEMLNHQAVKNVYNQYSDIDKQIITRIYSSENMFDEINKIAKEYRTKSSKIWSKLSKFEKKIAVKRGLV